MESVLVVVEGDAACPLWLEHWGPEPSAGWSMLEREEWEPEAAFLDRVSAALSRSALGAATDDVILLVSSRRVDTMAMASRWKLSTTLMQHLAQVGGGKLLLTRGYGHDDAVAPLLSTFVDDLAEEFGGTGAIAALHVDEPPRSQVRASYTPAAPRAFELAASSQTG